MSISYHSLIFCYIIHLRSRWPITIISKIVDLFRHMSYVLRDMPFRWLTIITIPFFYYLSFVKYLHKALIRERFIIKFPWMMLRHIILDCIYCDWRDLLIFSTEHTTRNLFILGITITKYETNFIFEAIFTQAENVYWWR